MYILVRFSGMETYIEGTGSLEFLKAEAEKRQREHDMKAYAKYYETREFPHLNWRIVEETIEHGGAVNGKVHFFDNLYHKQFFDVYQVIELNSLEA